jgi:Flp pilus assembly pilin Flp
MGGTSMKKFKNFSKNLFKNKSGQGATEYILLLVVIVGLVMLFKDKIKTTLNDKVEQLGSDIRSVNSN